MQFGFPHKHTIRYEDVSNDLEAQLDNLLGFAVAGRAVLLSEFKLGVGSFVRNEDGSVALSSEGTDGLPTPQDDYHRMLAHTNALVSLSKSRYGESDAAGLCNTTERQYRDRLIDTVYQGHKGTIHSYGYTDSASFRRFVFGLLEQDVARIWTYDGFRQLVGRTAGAMIAMGRVQYVDMFLDQTKKAIAHDYHMWDGETSVNEFTSVLSS